jgi:hypothetical protein
MPLNINTEQKKISQKKILSNLSESNKIGEKGFEFIKKLLEENPTLVPYIDIKVLLSLKM